MFCKNCGSNIKDGAGFCPKCGSSTGMAAPSVGSGIPQEFQMTLNRSDTRATSRRNTGEAWKKLLPVFGIVLAAILVVVGIAAVAAHIRGAGEPEPEIEYTIMGDWVSTEDHSLVDALVNLMEKEGIGDMANSVVQLMGLDGKGRIGLCFAESGNMYLGVDKVFVSIGAFSYEEIGKGSVMMNYNLDLNAWGFNVPISLSYKAKYRVDEVGLTLDLFGEEINFIQDTF